jgi:excisionase family DNA binding protein
MEAKLLNPAQVAEILNISKAGAYTLLRCGEIRTVRIGTSVRVRWEDLQEYIKARAEQSAGEVKNGSGMGQ